MNRKIPVEKTKRKGFFNLFGKEESKERLLENLSSNPYLSDEERFDRYLQIDLRIPSSYTQLDLETERALKRYADRFRNWSQGVAISQKFIRGYQKKLFVSPTVALVFSIPFVGFYIANRTVHTAYQYRLPSSMPGLSMVCKKASVIDWSTVVGTQFFHQIDWNDVGVSLYRPDSAFVLFSPKVQFEKQEKFIGCFETVREYDNGKTIDLVQVDKNTYAAKKSHSKLLSLNFLKANLVKRVTKTLAKPMLLKLRKDRSLAKHKPIPVFSSPVEDIPMGPNVGHSQNSELKRLNYPPRKLFSLHSFSRPSYISRPKKLIKLKNKKDNRVVVKDAESILFKSWIDQKQYVPLTNGVASRDHHVLMQAEQLDQINERIQKKFSNKNKNLLWVKNLFSGSSVKSQHYWQTFFTSLDLIPSQMQSMTFPNKPKRPIKDQFLSDIKAFEKDINVMEKAFILPNRLKEREKLLPLLYEKLAKEKRERYKKEEKLLKLERKKPSAKALTIMTPVEKPLLAGFNTNTDRRAKRILVASDRRNSFDLYHDNPYTADEIEDMSSHVIMLRRNWEHRILERYKRYNPGWWKDDDANPRIPPLFNINHVKEKSPLELPEKKRATKIYGADHKNQDPASKIFILSQAIQDNFQNSLNTNIAVRQSSRYLIYNTLFTFKNLIGRNYYNNPTGGKKSLFENMRPMTFLADSITEPNTQYPIEKHTKYRSLDKRYWYNQVLQESEKFNIFANFPYTKRYEVAKAKNLVYSNNELTEFEKVDPELKSFIIPLQNTNLQKLRRRRWWFLRRRMKKIDSPMEKIEPKYWSNWENQLNKQNFDDAKSKKFGLTPTQEDQVFLVGKLDWDKIELLEQKLKNEKDPLAEVSRLVKYYFRDPKLKRKENFEARLRYLQLRRKIAQLKHDRLKYRKGLLKNLYKLRNLVSKKPVFPEVDSSTDYNPENHEFYKARVLKDYYEQIFPLVANIATIVPQRTSLLAEEEMLIKMFDQPNIIKTYMEGFREPLEKESPNFLSVLLPKTKKEKKTSVQAMVRSSQIQEKLIDQAIESYYYEQGRFVNKFDVSPHGDILRDLEKSNLMTWRKIKGTKELQKDQVLEFYAPLELLNLQETPSDGAKIRPSLDKFNVGEFKTEYRRHLLSNPFRIIPELQQSFFTRLTCDIIENQAYEAYLNWYKYFFLKNVHFIRPVFELNELDHLLKPNQLKAYKEYFKATNPARWTQEELNKMPLKDKTIIDTLKLHKKESAVDLEKLKVNYLKLLERFENYKVVRAQLKGHKALWDRVDKIRANFQSQSSPFEEEVKLTQSKYFKPERLSDDRYLEAFTPADLMKGERRLTRQDRKERRGKLREAKTERDKTKKEEKIVAKLRRKADQDERDRLEKLKTPEQKRLEKEQKRQERQQAKEQKRQERQQEKEQKRQKRQQDKKVEAFEKKVKKFLAKRKDKTSLKGTQYVDLPKNFNLTKPETRKAFVERYGEKALEQMDLAVRYNAEWENLVAADWDREHKEYHHIKLESKKKMHAAALFDHLGPKPDEIDLKIDDIDLNKVPEEGLTYMDLFKKHLVYYLTSPAQKLDPLYHERLMFEEHIKGVFPAIENNDQNTEKPDLSEAYKGIAKEFGWAKKTPFSEAKEEVTKAHLNQEIVNAFIRSQKKFLKSKAQKEKEATFQKNLRKHIIQGHSPYLKRGVSGYLNPDATFQDKFGELAGWDNVFEKVKKIYRLTESSKTNIFSAAQLAFIQRWGRLSTINSPLYQLTSPSRIYHYECFGRLINHRTSSVLDFKQLNLHSVLKAGNPYRVQLPRNYFAVTHDQLEQSYYPGVQLNTETLLPVKLKRRQRKQFSFEPLVKQLMPKLANSLDPQKKVIPNGEFRELELTEAELESQIKSERWQNSENAFQTYDNNFQYMESMNNFEDSDDNFEDSDDNFEDSDEKLEHRDDTLDLKNDHFYDSDDYNSDENFDDSSQRPKLEKEQKRLEKEQKRLEKEQKRHQEKEQKEQKEQKRHQEKEQERRQKTQELEMKANPIFDNKDPTSSKLFNSILESYKLRPNRGKEYREDFLTFRKYTGFTDDESEDGKAKSRLVNRNPLNSYPEILAYKNRGLPNNVFKEERSQELIDAKALMNKVRHRFFDSQNFERPMSRIIDHSVFDYAYWENLKWIHLKTNDRTLHTRSPASKYLAEHPELLTAHQGWAKNGLLGRKATKEKHKISEVRSRLISNISLTNPAFVSYVLFLFCMAKICGRLKQDYQRVISLGIANFLSRLDLTTIKSIVKVNNAVVRCQGIQFNQIVGGEKLLYLFYPLILWNRNKHFSFGTLPVFEYNLLQKLASGSPDFVLKNDAFELTVLQPTEKEIEMSRKFEQARNYMVHIEQQNCLLIGPPGTGKTFLVKALAAESYIPVILPTRYEILTRLDRVESNVENPDEILRMRQLFEVASYNKPCILFLDEIDSMGQDRQDVLVDTNGPFIGPDYLSKPSELVRNKAFGSWRNSDSISMESVSLDHSSRDYYTLANPAYGLEQLSNQIGDSETDFSIGDSETRQQAEPGAKKVSPHAVAKLAQLLCLLDGTNQRQILIIGATNRPETLDPALTRPGRLNKVFYLDLPSKQKRLDLLKFYSRSRVTGTVDWDYFAKKTVGLSPAHLKAAMNLSALKTAHELIEKQRTGYTKVYHSETSIEYGIQSVMNTKSVAQGFITQSTQRLNKIMTPLFFDDIGQIDLWQHVSLGSPVRPIVLPECQLSSITSKEKFLTKTETQVWNKLPNHIPRVSFPTLYNNVTEFVLQSIQGPGYTTHQLSKNGMSTAKRREGRLRFYERNRAAWRSAYLLSDPKTINYSLLKNVTIDDHPFKNGFTESPLLDKSSAETLTLFKEYVDRVFRVHMLGSKLLLHSTYAVDNPLMFKTEFVYKKGESKVVRSSGQFTRFCSPTPLYLALLKENPTLFMQPDKVETTLGQMFSHSLALHRSIAYNANKALMVHFLTDTFQQEHVYDIWNRVKYNANPKKYQQAFIKSVQENFVTRKDFENYLVALSAGKVGEHLMLFYREALPKFDPLKPRFGRYTYDVSEIGRQELQQMTWLLNIMIEKNLFYSPSVDLSKQLLTPESYSRSSSKFNTSVASVASNKELWTAFDKNHATFTEEDKNPIVTRFMSLFTKPNTTYWWEPNGLDLPSPGNVNSISSWTSLFSTKKERTFQRMPANLNYDIYRPNVLRTASLLDSPFDAKYLPSSFVESVTKQGDTWNQSCFSDTERLTRALLLDTFAKSFYILAGHRELCDLLSYHLVRSGKLPANKLKHICEVFLEPANRERLAQIEKDKAIDEQILNLQNKKSE